MITINRRFAPSAVAGSTEQIWYKVTSVKLFNWFTLFRFNEQLTDPRENDPSFRLKTLSREMQKSDPLTRSYDAGYQAGLTRAKERIDEALPTPALPPIPQPK